MLAGLGVGGLAGARRGTWRSTRAREEAEGMREVWARDFPVVSGEGKDKAAEAGLGLADLNNFSTLWDLGVLVVPGWLVSGPGGIGQEDSGLGCESPSKEVVGSRGSGLTGLHLDGALYGSCLLSPRIG